MYNPNELIISTDNIKFNINLIKEHIGKNVEVMPVIKANAYGVGVQNIIPILNSLAINIVGVATVEEAVEIRKMYSGQIVVLLQPLSQQIGEILENDIIINVSDFEFLKELNNMAIKSNKIANVHIEIDTGMGRTGVKLNLLEGFCEKCLNLKNIKVNGISTHFSSSSSDEVFTQKQIAKFEKAIKTIKGYYSDIKYIHACNSGGILNFPNAYYNLVRTGIMLYGYYPKEKKIIELKPALSFETQISYIHKLNEGDTIGYNKTIIAKQKMQVGIIPFGFADAFMGLENDEAYVLVNNKKSRILAICMDTMIIDLSDIKETKVNDKVIIWDNENITLEDWANWTKTSNYEVLSILSKRIERKLES